MLRPCLLIQRDVMAADTGPDAKKRRSLILFLKLSISTGKIEIGEIIAVVGKEN